MTQVHIPQGYQGELARGNVKAAMKAAGARSADIYQVPLDKMQPMPGLNGRIRTPAYLEYIDDLATSIIENGYYQDKPLAGFVAVEGGKEVIYITEGESRYRACLRAVERGFAIETVPMVTKPRGTNLIDLTFDLVGSNQQRPFTTYETALLCKRLIGMGIDERSIAKRMNFKTGKRYVDDLLNLASVDNGIRDLLIEERVSATMVMDLLRSDPENARKRILAAVNKAQAAGKAKATPKHDTSQKTEYVKLETITPSIILREAGVNLDDKKQAKFAKDLEALVRKYGISFGA